MKKRKTMTAMANEYLRHRRKLGYQLDITGKMLLNFARWADRIGHRGPLTVDLAVRWARLPKNASPTYWAHPGAPSRVTCTARLTPKATHRMLSGR